MLLCYNAAVSFNFSVPVCAFLISIEVPTPHCFLSLTPLVHSPPLPPRPLPQFETEAFLKSLLAGTRCPLHLHFLVAGEPEVSALQAMMRQAGATPLAPLPAPPLAGTGKEQNSSEGSAAAAQGYEEAVPAPSSSPLLFSLHQLPQEWVEERAKALHMFPPSHHAGLPGFSKFFLPDIMWQVDRAIYLDVDMVAGTDIAELHGLFAEFDADPQLLYYMASNHPEGGGKIRYTRPLCSCQMVMDLERLRQRNLTQVRVHAHLCKRVRVRCVNVCACARACVRACVWVCVCAHTWVHVLVFGRPWRTEFLSA